MIRNVWLGAYQFSYICPIPNIGLIYIFQDRSPRVIQKGEVITRQNQTCTEEDY